jgi:hypothetical protein
MGEIVGATLFSYLEGAVGEDADGQLLYEPRDKQKGNVARAMFYMCVAYNGISGNDWSLPSGQDQVVLKNWHYQDLPDNYEIARHELMFFNQGNRNPFIDSVDMVCFIDFSTMTYNPNACNLGLSKKQAAQPEIVAFPNPSNDVMFVQVTGFDMEALTLVDMQGRVVLQKNGLASKYEKLSLDQLEKGVYLLTVQTTKGIVSKQIVVE